MHFATEPPEVQAESQWKLAEVHASPLKTISLVGHLAGSSVKECKCETGACFQNLLTQTGRTAKSPRADKDLPPTGITILAEPVCVREVGWKRSPSGRLSTDCPELH